MYHSRRWLEQCLTEHDACRKEANVVSLWTTGSMVIVERMTGLPRRLLQLDPGSENHVVKLVEFDSATKQKEESVGVQNGRPHVQHGPIAPWVAGGEAREPQDVQSTSESTPDYDSGERTDVVLPGDEISHTHSRRSMENNDQTLETPTVSGPSNELPAKPDIIKYVALSHRWGPSETFKTTRATLEQYKEGVELSRFPRTYRDAIDETRRLGYEYIWIDSLCIVQDDADDWKEEAPRMAVIYGLAVCSILAMDGKDSEAGLFLTSTEEPENLTSRGWVVQEVMLPNRTLVYTRGGVQWECRECQATEASPDITKRPDGSAEGTLDHPKQLYEFMRDFRLRDPVEEPDQRYVDVYSMLEPANRDDYLPILKAWWRFIELYTPCGLSFDRDRFLAMNGIAAVTHHQTHLQNTWGLWQDFLERDLLWSIDPKGPEPRRPKEWLAPYWSWASTVGGRVVNDAYKRLHAPHRLLIKPEVRIPQSTSFDQALPMGAWTSHSYKIELKGDMRSGAVIVERYETGSLKYSLELESTGRWSENEEHEFRPDAALEEGTYKVTSFLVVAYKKEDLGGDWNINVSLALTHAVDPPLIDHYVPADFDPETTENWDRVMKRVGYIETRYKEQREWDEIYEDYHWKYVQLW